MARAASNLAGSIDTERYDLQPPHERDVVVVWQKLKRSEGASECLPRDWQHVRVLQFGGHPVSTTGGSRSQTPDIASRLGGELHIPSTCPRDLRALVEETLVPMLAARSARSRYVLRLNTESETREIVPLLVNSEGRALAAIYRHADIQEAWWLPIESADAETFDFTAWVRAAFEEWHHKDAERFPGAPDWARQTDWMTREELQLQAGVEAAQADLLQQQALLAAKVADAEAALAAAQARHDNEERILLTGQGDNLVQAVHAVLLRLGFGVIDVDKKRAAEDAENGRRVPRPKMEDLRVSEPGSSWVALAEVKGYVGGGKTSDFQKIGRFVSNFQAQNDNALPDATWYVVNQFLDTPPHARPQLMVHQAEDVEVFAETVGGVLVDTRDLFVLDRVVAAGELSQAEARARLMAAKVRFSLEEPLPPAQPEETEPEA